MCEYVRVYVSVCVFVRAYVLAYVRARVRRVCVRAFEHTCALACVRLFASASEYSRMRV